MESSSKMAKTSEGSDASGSGSRRQGMLAVNDLTYLLEPDLSVAVGVTHKNHFFQSTDYTSTQRAVCILNSGADYIDTRDSYLQFDLSTTKQGRGYFGAQGSVLNIIKTVTISTRSGDEISRIVDCNRLNNMINSYRFDSQWMKTVGQSIAVGAAHISPITYDENGNPDTYKPKPTTYCIPMYLLSDFFGYGRLLPSMIMSGLRIEIEFENPDNVFIHSNTKATDLKDPRYNHARLAEGATGAQPLVTLASGSGSSAVAAVDAADLGDFTISGPQFVLKSVQLTDATQRALNEMSATNGLEIVYTDFERTETQITGSGNHHVEVRKACSRALQAYARIRVGDTTQLGKVYEHALGPSLYGPATGATASSAAGDGSNYTNKHFDSFASEPLSQVRSYQWQLGSLYFPQQPIKGKIDEVALAGYCQSLISVGKWGPNRPRAHCQLHTTTSEGEVRHEKLVSTVERHTIQMPFEHQFDRSKSVNQHQLYEPVVPQAQPGTFTSWGQTWVVGLERSSMFELAGVPINNSRVLALRFEVDLNIKRVVDVYLKYVKLARVFLNNVEVEQ